MTMKLICEREKKNHDDWLILMTQNEKLRPISNENLPFAPKIHFGNSIKCTTLIPPGFGIGWFCKFFFSINFKLKVLDLEPQIQSNSSKFRQKIRKLSYYHSKRRQFLSKDICMFGYDKSTAFHRRPKILCGIRRSAFYLNERQILNRFK